MKKLFPFICMFCMSMIVFAQNTLVATLTHGNEISMFYGTYALQQANRAAQSGDVINLSGGSFQATNITKGISLRGTGIDDVNPTYIINDFEINIPSSDTCRLSMEGIRCTGNINMGGTFNRPYFVKSKFHHVYFNDNSSIKNALFANCKITDSTLYGSSTVQFINSYVSGFYSSSATASSFVNCVISSYNMHLEHVEVSQLYNCIIVSGKSTRDFDYSLPSTTTATNCVSIGYKSPFSQNPANTKNKAIGYTEYNKVFKDFTGSYSDIQTFELTDEAKTEYLGNDGTEVGMHGGIMPYSSTPSYPQITKMNVANKTTADGKLSVEIEVSAVE